MTLSFTSIEDRHGPAVYLLGNRMIKTKLQRLKVEVDRMTPSSTQVIYIDTNGPDGTKIASFYGVLESMLPAVLIVMDDDSLHKMWTGQDLPSADQIAHTLRAITGSHL